MTPYRDLKRGLRRELAGPDWRAGIAALAVRPARRLFGPFFSLLGDGDEAVRWRAVIAFGVTAARLADGTAAGEGMEAARVIMRQCLWRLNDESGGPGWGVPEAMGEALARHARLAGEYHRVLASFVRQETHGEGNYLEMPALRSGVFWGLGRLAETFPQLVRREVSALTGGLSEEDASCRGLAARACGLAGIAEAVSALEGLAADPAELTLWLDGEPVRANVGGLARGALARLRSE